MTDRTEALEVVIEKATEIDYLLGEFLSEYASARVSHARAGVSYLISALRRDMEVVDKKAVRQAQIFEEAARNSDIHDYTDHERNMAAINKAKGIEWGDTPAKFRAAREENMRTAPRPQTQAEIDEVMRNAR